MDSPALDALTKPLHAMALGRIALGVGSLAAPGAMARSFGVRSSPELDYMTRVFGGRAIALGLAYLTGQPAERTRLQRLCLAVDVSDTVAGISELLGSREVPRRGIAASVVLTGTYAAFGAGRVLSDLRRR